MNAAAKRTRYPLRAMRYWLADQLIRGEIRSRGEALTVLEVGVDGGQMLAFMKPDSAPGLPGGIARWDAVTLRPEYERLGQMGYSNVVDQDVEDPAYSPGESYDVVIVLHVLEHLCDPEAAVDKLARCLRPGGTIIGGYPSVPNFCRRYREERLRSGASRYGHQSKFSVDRTRRLAAGAGLQLEWMTGAFFMRSRGSRLENRRWWTRFNLAFGALFPGWPGELYWMMRRPPGSNPIG